jgi:ATP-dependent DNA helicase RecG
MAEKKSAKTIKEENEGTPDNKPIAEATTEDLDTEKVNSYLHTLEAQNGRVTTLMEIGLVRADGSVLRPTVTAMLVFGKNQQKFLPHASMKLARFRGRDVTGMIVDRAELYGPLDRIIEEAARFVLRNMRVAGPIQGLYRDDTPEYPIVAVREAITNAVAHRDYSINGQKILLRMFDDRLEVESPGGLTGPVTLENLGQKRFSRNPLLTRLMYELRLVEEMGTGIKRMRREMAELGSAPPQFNSESNSFTVVLPARQLEETRPEKPAAEENQTETNAPLFEITKAMQPEYFSLLREGLHERQARGLLYARQKGRLTNREYRAINPDITDETARLDLLGLVDKGYLVKFGDKRGAAYLPR